MRLPAIKPRQLIRLSGRVRRFFFKGDLVKKSAWKGTSILITLGILCLFVNLGWTGQLPAFPGAQGYGAIAVGGRGGQVIEVTNLKNDGPGSLRAAVEAKGPRTVVFRVAGEIVLPTSDPTIKVRNPYITIAGQTAPGDGITIRSESGDYGPLIALVDGVHDVVIRYLKLRYGKGSKNADNLTVRDASRVIIDHVSAQWASDENISVTPSTSGWNTADVTIQRSIIAQTFKPHSTGTLITRYGNNDQITERISVHHNLFAHNGHRNPRVSAHLEVTKPPDVQVINNLVYNWDNRIGTTKGGVKVDLIGNYWKAGPMSSTDRIYRHEHALSNDRNTVYPPPSILIKDNIALPKYPDPSEDNWQLLRYHYHLSGTLPLSWRRHTPLVSPFPIVTQSSQEAYTSILDDVGCNGRLAADGSFVKKNDAIDRAILDDVINGTGPARDSQMDHHDDFGGYLTIDAGKPYRDTDHDGMPDVWETNHSHNPQDPSDGAKDSDGDGYTNLEEFLNGTDPRIQPQPPDNLKVK
jgi:pectate lyase